MRGLRVLLAVTDRLLGSEATVSREIRALMETREDAAYRRTCEAFNELPMSRRARVGSEALDVARHLAHPTEELRRRFPTLFSPY